MSERNTAAIYDILYRLGITANYRGFFHTVCAVDLAAEQPERLMLVTKWLYPEVARRYGTSWQAVERNIRSAADIAWRTDRALLEQMARTELPRRPSASRFLAILVAWLAPEDVA